MSRALFSLAGFPVTLIGRFWVTAERTTISGSVRITATLLEVLVATKIAPLSGLDPADA
jgi:hypothetical protein